MTQTAVIKYFSQYWSQAQDVSSLFLFDKIIRARGHLIFAFTRWLFRCHAEAYIVNESTAEENIVIVLTNIVNTMNNLRQQSRSSRP